MIEFACEHCGTHFQVEDSASGTDAWCRTCRKMIIIPGVDGQAPSVSDLPIEEFARRLDSLFSNVAFRLEQYKILLQKELDKSRIYYWKLQAAREQLEAAKAAAPAPDSPQLPTDALALQEQLREETRRRADAEAALEQSREEMDAAVRRTGDAESRLEAAREEAEQLREALDHEHATRRTFETQAARYHAELEALHGDLSSMRAELEAAHQRADTSGRRESELAAALKKLDADTVARLDQANAETARLLAALAQLEETGDRSRTAAAEAAIQESRAAMERLEQRRADAENRAADAESRIHALEVEIAASKRRADAAAQAAERAETALADYRADAVREAEARADAERRATEFQTRAEMLQRELDATISASQQRLSSETEQLRRVLEEAVRAAERFKTELTSEHAHRAAFEAELARARAEIASLETRLAETTRRADTLLERPSGGDAESARLADALRQALDDLRAAHAATDDARTAAADAAEESEKWRTHAESLREQLEMMRLDLEATVDEYEHANTPPAPPPPPFLANGPLGAERTREVTLMPPEGLTPEERTAMMHVMLRFLSREEPSGPAPNRPPP